MNCRSVRKHLGRYQDGDLPAGRRLELEEHLTNCRACAREQAELRGVVELVESLEEVAPPAHFTAHVLRALASDAPGKPALEQPAMVPVRLPLGALLGVAGLMLTAMILAGALTTGVAGLTGGVPALAPVATAVAKTLSLGLEVGSVTAEAVVLACGKPFLWLFVTDIALLLLILTARKRLLRVSPRKGVGVIVAV